MSNDDLSRRDALSGGAAAVLAGVGAALAVSTVGRDAQAQSAADAAALNTLLLAEYDAVLTYQAAENYLSMPDMTDPDRAQAATVASVAMLFRGHHNDHATRLSTLITSLGGTPRSRGSVLTPMLPAGFRATVMNLIKLAANKEKAAAIAYVNALKNISSVTAADLTAAIGGVETQHFIVLYLTAKNVFTIPTMGGMVNALCPRPFVSLSDTSANAQTLASLNNIPFIS